MKTTILRRSFAAVAVAGVLALAGCSGSAPADAPVNASNAVVQELGFTGKTPEQIVQAIDSSPDARPLDFGASVRGTQLVLTKGDQETTLTLPQDKYYLSVAPYQNQTHECYFHSLATCHGELGNAAVKVSIVDDKGKVLVDEQTKTYANGFVGFWLPRDIKGTVTMAVDGVKGSAPFATTDGSATCMTTLKLTEKA